VAKAKRILVTNCLVRLGASGTAAQCGACSALESGVVHMSRWHDTPRTIARQQERAFLLLYVLPGRGGGYGDDARGPADGAGRARRSHHPGHGGAQHLELYRTTLYLSRSRKTSLARSSTWRSPPLRGRRGASLTAPRSLRLQRQSGPSLTGPFPPPVNSSRARPLR